MRTVRGALLVVLVIASAASARAQETIPTLAHLTLRADRAGVTFSLRARATTLVGDGSTRRRFERLCTAPCDVMRPPGTATLLVEASHGGAQTLGALTLRGGDTTLVAHYQSHADERIGLLVSGSVLMAGSLGALIACLWPGVDAAASTMLAVISTILLVFGALIAVLADGTQDEASVTARGEASILRLPDPQ